MPLAFRRRFPLTAFLVLLLGALATRQYATDLTFLAIVFAGYSAVAYSRFRNAALLSMPVAGLLVAVAFWTATLSRQPADHHCGASAARPRCPGAAWLSGAVAEPVTPWRLAGIVVAASLILIAVIGNRDAGPGPDAAPAGRA